MNWQQLMLIGPQVFPVTLLFAAILTLLTTMTLRNPFSRGLCGVILGLAALVAIPFVAMQSQSVDSPNVSLLALGVLRFHLDFVDSLSLLWVPLTTLLLIVLLAWPQSPGTFPVTFRREVQSGLLLVAAVQWMSLAADAWVQWGLASFSGWMLALTLARESGDSGRGKSAVACLVWFTVADFLWLLGLIWLSLILPVSDLKVMSNLQLLDQLSEGEKAICVSGLSLLAGGLLLRCGMYPLMSWISPAVRTSRDGAWLTAFGLGTGTVLLLRWAPLMSALPETRWLMAGMGGLSTVLLVVIAWGNVRIPLRLTCAAASQLALVWIGIGIEPSLLAEWIAFAFAMIWLQTLLVLSLPERDLAPGSSSLAKPVLFILIVITCMGVLGQEQVFFAIYRNPELPAMKRWLLLGGGMLSLLLTARLLSGAVPGRKIVLPEERLLTVPAEGVSAFNWLALLGLTGLVLAGIYGGGIGSELLDRVELRRPDLGILLMLIGLISAWTWPESSRYRGASVEDRWELVRRLARSEFYLPAAINLLILLPIRAGSQISRFLEWFVFGNLTMQFPVNFLNGIARSAHEADEDADESARMWQMVNAVAAMLVGVAIGMLL